jgi:L-amino acid N-acyltransferase YncA
VEVRAAGAGDWPQIWPLLQEVVRAGETYAYDPDMTPEQGRAAWMAEPPGATVVAESDGVVLGTARMGPNRQGPGAHIGTASFLVSSQARGRGVGRLLATHVVDWHRRHGYRGIQFNAVVETNTAAVALWTSLGFTVVGTVPGAFRHPEHGYVGLHVMHLSLIAPFVGSQEAQ